MAQRKRETERFVRRIEKERERARNEDSKRLLDDPPAPNEARFRDPGQRDHRPISPNRTIPFIPIIYH